MLISSVVLKLEWPTTGQQPLQNQILSLMVHSCYSKTFHDLRSFKAVLRKEEHTTCYTCAMINLTANNLVGFTPVLFYDTAFTSTC